ncbi:RNA polymerase sigma factor FliA [Novilysobacter spongiicola]|uniref:RNA polymerase sigma factor FliA n=1 Tax=Lysobacter spongiicola DSM 21749 TaxID=1122188 RepID=A0A1T4S151_9GAMM|nr:RNA polymerase sigma factor FliA [Lysobacter spongiicola]MDX1549939.1 RNA polymerase sigma factor FliA [Lysobacter spongiicola]SKA21897.1 RNA polymerase sigma factor for flagellar operon FliA [Lysobacter spongiicola DSM 21749]
MSTAAAAYRATLPPRNDAADVVALHGELVRRIAHHLAARLPSSVEVDDLIQAGMLGLIDAARNFKDDQGAAFETYASIRIRGAMIDEIRRGDWVPRSVHRRYRDVVSATRAVEQATGRAATSQEVAAELEVSLEEYHRMLEEAARGQLVSLDAHIEEHDGEPRVATPGDATPARAFEHDAFRESLGDAIEDLPEREQLVLSLYYEQEMNLREIGAVLSISESRVCQIHGQAMLRLRARLGDWRDSVMDQPD